MENRTDVPFLWLPGSGPDEDALARMRSYLPRPLKPMGEAWFMSKERKMHQELFTLGAAKLPLRDLHSALEDIASGTQCFGHFEEWDMWLPHMLPDLVLRSHEHHIFDILLENTITAFMAVYWTGIPEEYQGFARDVRLTLGKALMKPELWEPDPLEPENPARRIPIFLSREDRGEALLSDWGSSNAPGGLAAAMAFCLKYLPDNDLRSWAGALFDIDHPHWRFAVLVWYVGALNVRNPSNSVARAIEKAAPGITWNNFHALKAPSGTSDADFPLDSGYNQPAGFLDSARLSTVLEAMRAQLTVERLAAWETTFWMDPLLASEPALPSILDRTLATLAA